MSLEKRIEKLRAEFEALDDTQRDYLVGIAKALSFAYAFGQTAAASSPPKPDRAGKVKDGSKARKGGG